MAEHRWEFDHATATENVWRCASDCRQSIGFPKPGLGEPSATDKEYPASIDKYVGPCEAPAVTPTVLTKRQFLDRFAMSELIAIRSAAKTDIAAETMLWKFDVTLEVPLDHTETRQSLEYLASLGLLKSERIAEVLS